MIVLWAGGAFAADYNRLKSLVMAAFLKRDNSRLVHYFQRNQIKR